MLFTENKMDILICTDTELALFRNSATGACAAYMARLRDALFMVHSEDLAAVEAALRLLGKTPEEIEEKKKTDWAYFLLRCRRYNS